MGQEQEPEVIDEITAEEFKRWRNDKVTKKVFDTLTEQRANWMMYLANGRTIHKDTEVSTDFVVGRIQGINDFLLMEYEPSREEKIQEGQKKYGY